MKYRRIIYLLIILLSLLIMILVVSCGENVGNDKDKSKDIKLNADKLIMTVGESQPVIVETNCDTNMISFISEDEVIATINEHGIITAVAVGKTTIKVTAGNLIASCEIDVADALVSHGYDVKTQGYGVNRFNKISDAVVTEGKVIVLSGIYPDSVISEGIINIIGEGDVTVGLIKGKEVWLENVSIMSQTFPPANTALVTADKILKINKCKFTVSESGVKTEDMTGGYGIMMSEGAEEILINETIFNNFRLALFLYHTAANINVTKNQFVNCAVAIDVNLRGDNSKLCDYEAVGKIMNNLFIDCKSDTKFTYSGVSYKGLLEYPMSGKKDK